MPRAAGDNPNYTFTLRDDNTGRHVSAVTIELPSVTTVIRRVLSKPALLSWTYAQTRDAFTGLAHLLEEGELSVEDFIDTMSDPDMAEEWMKENALRPQDVTTEASKRGTEKHLFLERLGRIGLKDDEAAIEAATAERAKAKDPFVVGVCDWWLERQPRVVASERVLVSLEWGVAGSLDLAYRYNDLDWVCVTDLKTRREGAEVYDSDFIQVDAYGDMWNENQRDDLAMKNTVLLVRGDGSYTEEDVPDKYFGVFELLNRVHKRLYEGKDWR